jgi:hypothetical protein
MRQRIRVFRLFTGRHRIATVGNETGHGGLTGIRFRSREDIMASLVLQDAFQPYYAGRDGEDDRAKPRAPSARVIDRGSREAIRLPSNAPAPAVQLRRERRPVAH